MSIQQIDMIKEYRKKMPLVRLHTTEFACHGIVAEGNRTEVLYVREHIGLDAYASECFYTPPFTYEIPVSTYTHYINTALEDKVIDKFCHENGVCEYRYYKEVQYYPNNYYLGKTYKALTFFCDSEPWDDPLKEVKGVDWDSDSAIDTVNQTCVDDFARMPREGNGSSDTPWKNVNWALRRISKLYSRGEGMPESQKRIPRFHVYLNISGSITYSIRDRYGWSYLDGIHTTLFYVLGGNIDKPPVIQYPKGFFTIEGTLMENVQATMSGKDTSVNIKVPCLSYCKLYNIDEMDCDVVYTCEIDGAHRFNSYWDDLHRFSWGAWEVTHSKFGHNYSISDLLPFYEDGVPSVAHDSISIYATFIDGLTLEYGSITSTSRGLKVSVSGRVIHGCYLSLTQYPPTQVGDRQSGVSATIEASEEIINSHIVFTPHHFSYGKYPLGVHVYSYVYAPVMADVSVDIGITGEASAEGMFMSCSSDDYVPQYDFTIDTNNMIYNVLEDGLWGARSFSATLPCHRSLDMSIWSDGHGRYYFEGWDWVERTYSIDGNYLVSSATVSRVLTCPRRLYYHN